jgi:Aspartyl protease
MPTVDYSMVRAYQRVAGDPVARPMLIVRLHHPPHPPFQTLAIVDSGADTSVFHVSVAAQLGIDLASARRVTAVGVGGTTTAYRSAVEMEIEGMWFPAAVRFTSGIRAPIALLGRHDVFRRFQFGFDEQAQILLVQPYR